MKTSILSTAIFCFFLLFMSACQQDDLLDEMAPQIEAQALALPAEASQRNAPNHQFPDLFYLDLELGMCVNGGLWAKPIDPRDLMNYNKFSFPEYVVEWFANGQLLHTGSTLPCTCGIQVEVVVIHAQTGYKKSRLLPIVSCPNGEVKDSEYTSQE